MITETASLWAGVRRFEDILKKDPHAYSFAPLAELYLGLGLVEDALRTARKGCVAHPDFAAGHMALARAALESSFKDEAKKALEKVVRITPENLEAQRLLADIFTADGELDAARRALAIVSSLEAMLPEQYDSIPVSDEVFSLEKSGGEEILELTDDLIESETYGNSSARLFSAEPERPSLGDAVHRPEPFMLETAPPLYDQGKTVTAIPPVAIEKEEAQSPVASATIAELYISQGLPDKGVEIYKAMLQDDPDNEVWKKRLAELTSPASVEQIPEMPVKAAAVEVVGAGTTESLLETLCGWLENIGRIRECRTKSI